MKSAVREAKPVIGIATSTKKEKQAKRRSKKSSQNKQTTT